MEELVSVIIPVYNVEGYLDKCIDSVTQQSYKNIEIILVDDGSTDLSGELCDKWAEKDDRIRVIHKINGGQSSARNRGIVSSRGNFLTFIDSDDYVSEKYIEVLLALLKKYDADISIAQLNNVYLFDKGEKTETESEEKSKEIEISPCEAIQLMLTEKGVPVSANAKLYKRDLFNNISFPEGKLFEDLFTTYKLFYKATKLAVSNKKIYNYLIRNDSTIGSLNPQKNLDLFYASKEIYDFISDKMPHILSAAKYKLFTSSVELSIHYPRNSKIENSDIELKKMLWNNVREYRLEALKLKGGRRKYRILAIGSYFGENMLRYFYQKVAKR